MGRRVFEVTALRATEKHYIFINITHLRCGPVGVRFMRLRRINVLAQTPGPDLACQDAAMESQTFISSENSCISTSRRDSRSRPGLGTGRAGLVAELLQK